MPGWRVGPCTKRMNITAAASPMTPMKKKDAGQPRLCTISASIGLKANTAKYWVELKIAEAVPRSEAGNQLATMRALAGTPGAEASPTTKRMMNMKLMAAAPMKKPAKPCARVKSDHRISAPV